MYDSLSYQDQIKKKWEEHELKGEVKQLSGAEYLSHFGKDDKLIPVITAVFYYGTKEWDGSVDLYGMFAEYAFLEQEVMRKYIPINTADTTKTLQTTVWNSALYCLHLKHLKNLALYVLLPIQNMSRMQ